MLDPDVLILAGLKKLGVILHKMVIEPLSFTIGGIPINAICLLLFLLVTIEQLYMYDKNHGGTISAKIKSKVLDSPKFIKWFVAGIFGLIGLILSI